MKKGKEETKTISDRRDALIASRRPKPKKLVGTRIVKIAHILDDLQGELSMLVGARSNF